MQLTQQNYYTTENKYLSGSKLDDWLKGDKLWFKKRHITHEIASEITDALVKGHAVDYWLGNGKVALNKLYTFVKRRDSKAENYRWQLNPSMLEEITSIVEVVQKQKAFKELSDHIPQAILQVEMPLGPYFEGICGIPDWYKIIGTHCVITDYKTAKTIDPVKYFYHCREYGYFRKQAFYQKLLKLLNPSLKTFESRHLVSEKDRDSINRCEVFILPQDIIEAEAKMIDRELEKIKNEKQFHSRNVSWDDAVLLDGEYHV